MLVGWGGGSKPAGSSVEGRVTKVRSEAVMVEERVGIKMVQRPPAQSASRLWSGGETAGRIGRERERKQDRKPSRVLGYGSGSGVGREAAGRVGFKFGEGGATLQAESNCRLRGKE